MKSDGLQMARGGSGGIHCSKCPAPRVLGAAYSPGAAARHSQSARIHVDFFVSLIFDFF